MIIMNVTVTVELVRASDQDASWTSPWEGVSGMPITEETSDRPWTCWRDYMSWLAMEHHIYINKKRKKILIY